MKLFDMTIRHTLPRLGTGIRWLKEELDTAGVNVHLSAGCLEEFVRDADECAWRFAAAGRSAYLNRFRQELQSRAQFVHLWTHTDEKIDSGDAVQCRLVRIARAYALPRPWKLSEPVVCEYRRPPGLRWHWASRASVISS